MVLKTLREHGRTGRVVAWIDVQQKSTFKKTRRCMMYENRKYENTRALLVFPYMGGV